MKRLLVFFSIAFVFGCSEEQSKSESLLQKRYWTPEDYFEVLYDIEHHTPEGEEYPRINNSQKSAIINKLLDTDNFTVVLEDKALGTRHKNEVAGEFFDEMRSFQSLYSVLDRQDKFVYAVEYASALKFGLKFQILYFDLGNQNIIESADDPNSNNVKNTVRSNENTCLSNFALYLDNVNREDAFTQEALDIFISGINEEFAQVLLKFPDADHKIIRHKAELMSKKATNSKLVDALNNLITLIDQKNPTQE